MDKMTAFAHRVTLLLALLCMFICPLAFSGCSAVEAGQVDPAPEPAPVDRGTALEAASKSSGRADGAMGISPGGYEAVEAGVRDIVDDAPLDASVAFIDLSSQGQFAGFGVNGNRACVAASMIKLVILAEFLEQVEQGLCSMEEPYTLQPEDIVGGTGVLQAYGAGSTFTYGDMAKLMISESDNVAANVITARVGGMDAVNGQAEKLGLSGTSMNRLMMDGDASSARIENFMSSEDTAILLAMIWREQLVSPQASHFALEALEGQSDVAGIAAGLPSGIAFAHKTGTLQQVRNDGGIVESSNPYVLVVLCSGTDSESANDLMASVSSVVYATFGGEGPFGEAERRR